jgi:hypothetical protein
MEKQKEIITTDDQHCIQLSKKNEDGTTLVQFYESISGVKWAQWAIATITKATRRRFEAKHTSHRLSTGLYRIPQEQ